MSMKENQAAPLEQEPAAASDELQAKLRTLFDDGRYEEYINGVAELAEHDGMTAEFVYDTAYAYFMAGDYERTAAWINTALTVQPEHVDARVLLARLCLMEDRVDDGLAIFDFILDKGQAALDDDKREELDDILSFYGRNENEKIREKYPHIAAFLQLDGFVAPESEPTPAAAPATRGSTDDVLTTLKQEIAAAEPDASAPPTPSAPSAAQAIDDVMARQLGLRQKVNLLNKFAGAAYLAGDLAAAEALLKAALKLDEGDQKTLRNLAIAEAELGHRDLAMRLVANMKRTDFALIRMIKAQ